jgi:hypothetical protein
MPRECAPPGACMRPGPLLSCTTITTRATAVMRARCRAAAPAPHLILLGRLLLLLLLGGGSATSGATSGGRSSGRTATCSRAAGVDARPLT